MIFQPRSIVFNLTFRQQKVYIFTDQILTYVIKNKKNDCDRKL